MTLRLSERPFGRCIFAVLFSALMAPAAAVSASAEPATAAAVIANYADIAQAGYEDAHTAARELNVKIAALIATPNDATLAAARDAWRAARVPYMQTEVFRFGNQIVDDWEGRVNAWPLDEGLIDYVSGASGADQPENEYFTANVIANRSLKIAGKSVDASQITPALLRDTLQEAGGVEANVATGYHAVEFLLWGQDLNGTKTGAGSRPATDYDLTNCSHGNCDRRSQYLKVVTQLLADDLAFMAQQWGKEGAARAAVSQNADRAGLTAIFTGLGSLSRGELAGDRMQVGLLVHDPEEEHDCFSDNTHNSHYYDAVGMQNVYLGRYKRLDGSMVAGPGVGELVRAKSAEADQRFVKALDATLAKMTALVERANAGEAYDMMIGEGNVPGNAAVQAAIDALIAQTKEIERAIAVLGLNSLQFDNSSGRDGPLKAASGGKEKG